MKLFTDGISEICFDKAWWLSEAKERKSSIRVELQMREKAGECMWCACIGEFIITKEECGKICPYYEPRNKKSGCCRYATQGLIGTGIFYFAHENGTFLKEQT